MANNALRAIARRTRRNLFGVAGPIDDLKASWDNAIIEFQQTRADLDTAESELYAVQYDASLDPADYEEWQSVFSKVNAAKSTMDAIASAVTTASDAWQSFTGLFGVRHSQGLTGALGLLPALPISLGALAAIIAGGAAAITAAYGFVSYINAKTGKYQQYIDSGMDLENAAEQARKDAQQESGYSFSARLESIAMFGILAVAAVMVLPKLFARS